MSDKCHLPSCPHPRVTETLCEYHAAKLLGRRPAEPQEGERKAAA